MTRLEGKVALVSGAGRGIGQAIALKLASEGARLVINDLDADPANETVELLKAKGVDAIVCMAVNDGFVMGAWGASQHVGDKIRMLGDGSATFTKALGLELDLTAKGMGVRCQRFSLLVEHGVVKQVNVEGVGPANCSFAEAMLAQLG